MISITKNLLTNYFLPLLREVLTDTAEGKKNQYLSKLLIAESLTALEKTNFMNDYFLTRPSYLQYLGNESEKEREFFREQFLSELAKGLENRLVLSGFEGLHKAYLPDKDKAFTSEKQRNVYLLAYNMALGFERKQASLLIQQKTESGTITKDQAQKDLQMLAKGELKVFKMNGKWQYLSEGQLRIIAVSPKYSALQVTPYITHTAERSVATSTASEMSSLSELEATQQAKATQTISAQTSQGLAAGSLETEQLPLADMGKLLNEAKLAQLEMMLGERGLNVINQLHIDDFGVVTGRVSDPQGQIYEIQMDTAHGIDPKDLKIAYSLPKEPLKKPVPEEKKKETIWVDFSQLKLKAQPQKAEKSQIEEGTMPGNTSATLAPPTPVFVLPQGKIPLTTLSLAPTKFKKPTTTKPRVPVFQHKMAREKRASFSPKKLPPTIRPPMKPASQRYQPPTAPTKTRQTTSSKKASKNPMARFATIGTAGAVAGFLGASGVIQFFLKS